MRVIRCTTGPMFSMCLNCTSMPDTMDSATRQFISTALPNLSADDANNLAEKLEDLGVKSIADIRLLKEDDLMPTLKPVQARKLLAVAQSSKFIFILVLECPCRWLCHPFYTS